MNLKKKGGRKNEKKPDKNNQTQARTNQCLVSCVKLRVPTRIKHVALSARRRFVGNASINTYYVVSERINARQFAKGARTNLERR